MADDLSEKLKSLLNNPEAINMFSSLLGSNNGASSGTPSPEPASENNDSNDFVSGIKNAMDKINGGNDRRINLLNALRPYMRDSRATNIDRAVKMLKMTRLTSILKDL